MIHLHSLFSSDSGTSVGSNSAPLSRATLDSFHGALSDAVSSTLEKFGIHPNDVKISITPASLSDPHPTSPTSLRTAPPTPGNPPTPSAASNSLAPSNSSSVSSDATSGAPNGGYDPFLQAAYNNPYQGATNTSTTNSTSTAPATQTNGTPSAAPVDAQQAFDDAYWASQPAAVQALRTMQNPDQRTALATQLANEGYSIDVPIMVWGWDPSIVTSMRQADGYTWVPSALQNPVESAPGLPGMGTFAAYNPKNPPAGSIAV
jgi:hypothetical protein